MKAIQFQGTVPRYIAGKVIGRYYPPIFWGGLSCTFATDIPEPNLPNEEWVKVGTRFGGICGTDLGAIYLKVSPYYSFVTSFPHTLGHENVGRILELGSAVKGWNVGERVVVEPFLWCRPRGIDPVCRFCAAGEINRCERQVEGQIAPGLQIGGCRDTGGSWSEGFSAHRSQLYRVPEHLSDENALMIEPFCIGLHAAIQYYPQQASNVLILGAGTIGLTTLAALRALGAPARITVMARYPFQAHAAEELGADGVILTGHQTDYYDAIARQLNARIYQPILGKRVMTGGFDQIFECVGSNEAIDDALRLTRSGGKVVLVGVPGIGKGIDWTAIFAQELEVVGSSFYSHAEHLNGKTWKTFDLAIDILSRGTVDLGWMVTHRFQLRDFHRALGMLHHKGKNEIIKAVFSFDSDRTC